MNFCFLFTHYLPFLQGSAVLETKSDSDILAEYQEDEFNKLYSHEDKNATDHSATDQV
jgi:hypothetical protein